AEQRSWTKPGRVSSAERVPPPSLEAASSTRTERPARARVMAAARPLGPAPTTTAASPASPAMALLVVPRAGVLEALLAQQDAVPGDALQVRVVEALAVAPDLHPDLEQQRVVRELDRGRVLAPHRRLLGPVVPRLVGDLLGVAVFPPGVARGA